MDSLERIVRTKNAAKQCPKCGNKLSYSSVHGEYFCKKCKHREKDLYGRMKDLIEMNPSLSKIEMSMILNVPMRDLSKYIDNGVLVNPNPDIP